MSQESMCRSEAQLQRSTATKDTSGGITLAWANQGDVAGCDIQPASATTVERYAQDQIEVSHTMYLFADCGAQNDDRFLFTDPDDDSQRIFKVRGVRKKAPGYAQWPYLIDVIEDPQS